MPNATPITLSRRDLSDADRIDYNTVVHSGGQPPPERRAALWETNANPRRLSNTNQGFSQRPMCVCVMAVN